MNHAERYMELYERYKNLSSSEREQVRICVSELVHKWCSVCDLSEGDCIKTVLKDRGNAKKGFYAPRISLGNIKVLVTPEDVDRKKVPFVWLQCIVHDIIPDTSSKGWESFECSHLCIVYDCVKPSHVVWEDKRTNQSRGYGICRVMCKHDDCGKSLCECQGIHTPSCI
jgi:hypothetical protein